jgi:hypothetical protein
VRRALGQGFEVVAKSNGFRKSGMNWTRQADSGAILAMRIQGSQGNTTDLARFTLNLGVYFPGIVAVLGRPDVPSPREIDCHIRERASFLRDGTDSWWTVVSDLEADVAGEDLVVAVKRYGLPWLMRVSETDGALAWLEEVGFPPATLVVAMALALADGDRLCASQIFEAHRYRMSAPMLAWALDNGFA